MMKAIMEGFEIDVTHILMKRSTKGSSRTPLPCLCSLWFSNSKDIFLFLFGNVNGCFLRTRLWTLDLFRMIPTLLHLLKSHMLRYRLLVMIILETLRRCHDTNISTPIVEDQATPSLETSQTPRSSRAILSLGSNVVPLAWVPKLETQIATLL